MFAEFRLAFWALISLLTAVLAVLPATADDTEVFFNSTPNSRSVSGAATSLTAPWVPVNAFNRTQNLQELFISVFQPSLRLHWPGNLKKYRLVKGVPVGQDHRPAVDPLTGFFADRAFSFWSAVPDGKRIDDGGAANELPDDAHRKLYTDISGPRLTDSNNRVTVANGRLTAAMLGAPPDERNNVINWARGLDILDENADGDTADTRRVMGDPLHVRPVTVTYGGTEIAPETTVFIATNDGYVHAMDAESGVELWAFIPERMLKRLYDLYRDHPSPARQYGLDGEFRVFIRNDDFQGGISGAEEVILLFGQRRGGDALFALNVTHRNNPEIDWTIDSNTPGYSELGQTWSRPEIARVNVNGTEKTVAVIGGGYDTTQDNPGYRIDNLGNAIYMVDIEDGSLVWSAGRTSGHDLRLPDMVNSIPASVNVLNLGQDQFADRMYVGDMGGRLWRFDINNGAPASGLVDGGVLASLGAADTGAGAPAAASRRFYNRPEIVPVAIGKRFAFAINIGSGYRAHPLDTATRDAFFSIRDFVPLKPIRTTRYGRPVTTGDLVDITLDTEAELRAADAGWQLAMVQAAGEKILSSSITFNGRIFFTSFSPPGDGPRSDATAYGRNRTYRVNVTNGGPSRPDEPAVSGVPALQDRIVALEQGGISPGPVFFFPADTKGRPIVCVGMKCFPPDVGRGIGKTFWAADETP